MGMYTGIRVDGKLKQEWIEKIGKMMYDNHGCAVHGDNFWNRSDHPVLKDFGDNVSRASFILYGALSYMPYEWEHEAEKAYYNKEILDDGTWRFQSSLKNYNHEIQNWMETVVPIIFESVEIEYYYEEWYHSKLLKLVDGKVIVVNENYIKYRGMEY